MVRDAYRVRTPENVEFEFELAGVAARALAWGLDVFVMTAMITVSVFCLGLVTPVLGGFAMAVMFIVVFLVQWWYSALCEYFLGGQTLGKRLVGIRTLTDRGFRIGFLQAVIRNLVRVVDILPGLYLVGGVSALLDGHRRRLGDLAAGTIVVRERRTAMPSAILPDSERAVGFGDDPTVAHAARRITPPERDAMVSLSLRRDELPLTVRHELFARFSEHLERRLGLKRPPHFSEERFVLNLTAVVLGGSGDRISAPPKSRPGQAAFGG